MWATWGFESSGRPLNLEPVHASSQKCSL
jgi:hypothetical protein